MNTMNKFAFAALCASLCAQQTFAQNESDALRYSQSYITGSARSQGVGGAFGAVGADFSSSAINPAGLGLYRRNEFVFGSAVTHNTSKATYFGRTLEDTRGNFNIPTLGYVGTKVFSEMGQDRKNGLVSVSIATGLNRVNHFQENIRFEGQNNRNSLLDYFKYSANGLNSTEILNGFNSSQNNFANIPGATAYNYYLLDTSGSLNNYKALTDGKTYNLKQQQQQSVRGATTDFNISTAVNLSNWVYLGGGLIIRRTNAETTTSFSEDAQGTVAGYYSSSLRQNIITSGSGVGGNFGVILRPLDFLKLGIAAQTSIRMNMRDEYSMIVGANNDSANTVFDPNRSDFIDYEIVTPAKYTLSGAVTLSKYGFISVDVEHTDFSKMRMSSEIDFFSDANNAISSNYQSTTSYRIGAEAKIAEFYRLRAGYGMYQSPFKNDGGYDLNRYSISGGIGFLVDRIFIDAAVVHTYGNQLINPYTTGVKSNDVFAVNKYAIYNFVVSGGIRF